MTIEITPPAISVQIKTTTPADAIVQLVGLDGSGTPTGAAIYVSSDDVSELAARLSAIWRAYS